VLSQDTPTTADHAACYEVVRTRDRRFDGRLFIAVKTTGIYCRPVCTVATPRAKNCEFYASAAAAEREGFRPCLRCRPELAPGVSAVDAVSRLSALAVRRIEDGALSQMSVTALAAELGVSARHLRRALVRETGVAPAELAQTQRLLHAKRLLTDTALPITEVAFACGFRSLSRFNASFRERYRMSPTRVRQSGRRVDRKPSGRTLTVDNDAYRFELAYRPPYAFDALLSFLEARATPGVEHVANGVYRRTLRVGEHVGWVAVERGSRPFTLQATIAPGLGRASPPLLRKLEALFDLRASSALIDAHLARDPSLRASIAAVPGLRVPGAVDGFELLVRAILGQQVTVAGATTLAGRVARELGAPIATPWPELSRLSPTAAHLAATDASVIAALGMPQRRAATIRAVAQACSAGALVLEPGSDPDRARLVLHAIDGIGDWTIEYVAMRALSWPDAFPSGDLGLQRALGGASARELLERSQRWRPWRAYAALRLWSLAVARAEPRARRQSAINGSNNITPAARKMRSAAPSSRIQS
jgi:AraC family transcriptional regulator of adaptative response / DNA-3-methyladenine glycosylase II